MRPWTSSPRALVRSVCRTLFPPDAFPVAVGAMRVLLLEYRENSRLSLVAIGRLTLSHAWTRCFRNHTESSRCGIYWTAGAYVTPYPAGIVAACPVMGAEKCAGVDRLQAGVVQR